MNNNDPLILSLREKYLGKWIHIKDKNGDIVGGKCNFIGYNEAFPQFGIQVTVGRLPIRHADINSIKISEEHIPYAGK